MWYHSWGQVTALFVFTFGGVAAQERDERAFWRPVVMGTFGMVAAEHPLETIAGMEILRAGGNAFDAAAAVFYMTTVVEQHQAGIGGDGFVLAYLAAEDRVVFINGTGPAPGLATRELYAESGEIPSGGPLATDVPGAAGGFDLALRQYGTMDYAQVLAPAIRAARDGHPVDFWASGYHARAVEKISPYPSSLSVLMPEGKPLGAGDVYVQSDLARSLEAISRGGIDVLYRGDLARRIASVYEREGGLLRYDDLARYHAEETSPISTTYAGLDVYQSAPNSQGIVMLIALNILEGFDLVEMGHNSADYVHVVTEAMKLAFADRNRYVADPDFADGRAALQGLRGEARRVDPDGPCHDSRTRGRPTKGARGGRRRIG